MSWTVKRVNMDNNVAYIDRNTMLWSLGGAAALVAKAGYAAQIDAASVEFTCDSPSTDGRHASIDSAEYSECHKIFGVQSPRVCTKSDRSSRSGCNGNLLALPRHVPEYQAFANHPRQEESVSDEDSQKMCINIVRHKTSCRIAIPNEVRSFICVHTVNIVLSYSLYTVRRCKIQVKKRSIWKCLMSQHRTQVIHAGVVYRFGRLLGKGGFGQVFAGKLYRVDGSNAVNVDSNCLKVRSTLPYVCVMPGANLLACRLSPFCTYVYLICVFIDTQFSMFKLFCLLANVGCMTIFTTVSWGLRNVTCNY